MKIVEGVYLHLLKTKKFKTNHLTCRFSSDMRQVNKARRSLVAQMLATASSHYPNSRLLRQKLAQLYGASLGTQISDKGLIHILDIDINFVGNAFAIGQEDLLEEVLCLLEELLFHPLTRSEQYQKQVFETEQTNLVNYLEADQEDVFYASGLELDQLYFDDPVLQESKYASPEAVAREDAYTALQEFRRMVKQDRIDIFLVGDFDDYKVLQRLHQFPLTPRQPELTYQYQQPYSNVTKEKLDKKDTSQSVLQLAYHLPVGYGSRDYFSLLVVNGLLGLFPHSLLFTAVREKEGLAYTIGSQVNPYHGVLKIHAGIDSSKRQRTMQLITKQLNLLKSGRFSPDLVKKTKKMLINGVILSQDSHKSLVEVAYNRSILPAKDLDDFKSAIEAVTKKDIIAISSQIRLQAVYFIEGDENDLD